MERVQARSAEESDGGFRRWLFADWRRTLFAGGALVLVGLAGSLHVVAPFIASFLGPETSKDDPARRTITLKQIEHTQREERQVVDLADGELNGHSLVSTLADEGLSYTPGAIRATRFEGAGAPVHTARINSEDGLPQGPVRRADVPAVLTYQLKPRRDLVGGDFFGGASSSLIQALESGALVNVVFDCSHCDEADRRHAPQSIRIDATAGDGVLRSYPLTFQFTPRLTAEGATGDLRLSPQLSLTFQRDGRDVDHWSIPLEILGDDRQAATEGVQLARETFADDDILDGELPVRLIYHRSPRGGIAIQVIAPLPLRPYFRALENDRPDDARVSRIGQNAIEYIVPVRDSSYEMIRQARSDLLAQMDTAFDLAAQPSTREPDDTDCPLMADAAESQTSDAIRRCIRSRVEDLRTHLVPPAMEQVLFDLARCQRNDEMRAPPLVIVSGVHYAPIQFLPVDGVGTGGGTCSDGLSARPTPEAWPASPSDDYLGLLLPIAIAPEEISNSRRGNRGLTQRQGTSSPRIVAGVYDETRPDVEEDDAFGFDEFASFAEQELQASVARDAETFRGRIADFADDVNLLIVNSHGTRGDPVRDLPDRQSDRIIFSHFDPNAPERRIPERALLTGANLAGHFVRRARATGRVAMPNRPTVLLLACDMAPYREGSTIPAAFFVGGARYVIATDSQVPADMAQVFGRAVIGRLRSGSSPPRAVFEARREIFRTRGTIVPLLWSVVAGP